MGSDTEDRRGGLVESAHSAFGASGGAVFGSLPRTVRRLGLSQATRVRPVDRLALADDHVLYGRVLMHTRRRSPG